MTEKIVYQKMNPEIKSLWLSTLRGGMYKQGEGYLEHKDTETEKVTHCCLGVLARCQGNKPNHRTGRQELPTEEFLKTCGLTYDIAVQLADMNDGGHGNQQSFKQIANWIERNL